MSFTAIEHRPGVRFGISTAENKVIIIHGHALDVNNCDKTALEGCKKMCYATIQGIKMHLDDQELSKDRRRNYQAIVDSTTVILGIDNHLLKALEQKSLEQIQ